MTVQPLQIMRGKILVVEDDFYLMEGIRDILELDGYDVITAVSGENALDVLQRQETLPDLIVSDIMMPGIDGYDLLVEVRNTPAWMDIPFIFLTAKGERADANRGRELGADDYVTKPFGPDDLRVAVSARLRRFRQMRKIHEQELDELRRRILVLLQHEFRTPLYYVVAYNDMLKQDAGQLTGQKLREYLEAIDEGATRLRRMIEDFIVLVEVETGEAIEAYNSHCKLLRDYPGFLLPIVERYEPALVNGSQTLRFDIDPATPPAPVHLPHFSKVIECLIDNAIKFGGPGNEITLRIASTRKIPGSSGQWISFEVSDHGRGIPERELPKIFDAFYQIDRQRTEDQGTGIGLAIVKGVVEAHGGQIQVRSRPGAGSTFIVLLPTHPN